MKLKKANTNHDFGLHAHRKYNIAMVKKVCVLSTPPSTLFPLFFRVQGQFSCSIDSFHFFEHCSGIIIRPSVEK